MRAKLLITVLTLPAFLLTVALPGCDLPDFAVRETGEEQASGEPEETAEETAPTIPPEIIITQHNTVPGDHIIMEIGPFDSRPQVELKSTLDGELSLPYYSDNYLQLLYGISYYNEPGVYELLFEVSLPDNEPLNIIKLFELAGGEFDEQRFTVPPSTTEGWTAERLEEDREKARRARETTEHEPLWDGPFIWPLEDRISSDYGAVRIINDGPPRRHNGIDIAAPEGTPLAAANHGIVRLAEHLLASGNVVYIDHGLDLSTAYLHMHEIFVEEGQTVEKGEIIGTVGQTGFASGPHLHWSVFIGHMPVSPYPFMEGLLIKKEKYSHTNNARAAGDGEEIR